MTTQPYLPDETELANCNGHILEDCAGENYDEAKADTERRIAKTKEVALRSAAHTLVAQVRLLKSMLGERPSVRELLECADRIKDES